MLGGRRALILAPHPDDESIGCGGLIAAACAAGTPPVVLILTDGAASHPGSLTYPSARLRAVREAEALAATDILGLPAGNLRFLREPDTGLAASGDVIETVLAMRARRAVRQSSSAHGRAIRIATTKLRPPSRMPSPSAPAFRSSPTPSGAGCATVARFWTRNAAMAGGSTSPASWTVRRAPSPPTPRSMAVRSRDSPTGFALGPDLLAIATRPFEVFVGP